MLNKIIIVLLVIVIAGSGVTGYYVYNQSQTIDSLNKQLIASQQAEINQINAVKNSEDAQITALGTELTSDQTANSTSITGLQNRLNQVDEENTTLGNEINTASTRITTLDGKIDSGLSAVSSQVSSIIPGVAADKIYSKVSPSIVQITDGTYTCGAGFIYDANGHVITAAHVIDGLKNISVILSDGTVSPATVVGSALHSDVTVLKLAVSTSLPPVTMAADNNVVEGGTVLAVGHPFDFVNSLSTGVVSQIHRFVNIGGNSTEHWLADLIQFDAATNPGNSGGPLFDQNGNVAGMVDAGVVATYGSGINFAVSSSRINKVVSDLNSFGNTHFPMIGIFVDDISQTEAASLSLKNVDGAFVINTSPGLPADKAGIIKGDIITEIGSTKINCADDLYSYFAGQAKVGDVITVHVTRGTQSLSINVTVAGADESHWWISMVPGPGSTASLWPES
jgi:S1-C subfamily serine protease